MITLILWLIYLSELVASINPTLSSFIKICTLLLLLSVSINRGIVPKFLYLYLLFFIFSFYPLYISFSYKAAINEYMRYISPMIFIWAIYVYKDTTDKLVDTLFIIALSNNLYMLYAYVAFSVGLPTLIGAWYDSGMFIRAYGWIGEVAIYAYLNFCCFALTYVNSFDKYKKYRWLFFIGSIFSFSFKVYPALITILIVSYYNRKYFIPIILAVFVTLIAFYREILMKMFLLGSEKIAFYITVGNSARYESYRVMYQSLASGNFFGEGIGGFGGPASTTYGSPLYDLYNFDWYGMQEYLKTTDTFYPHVFVELGLFTGTLYLVCLYFPIIYLIKYSTPFTKNNVYALVIFLSLVFDAFWSFNLTSLSYIAPCYISVMAIATSNKKRVG